MVHPVQLILFCGNKSRCDKHLSIHALSFFCTYHEEDFLSLCDQAIDYIKEDLYWYPSITKFVVIVLSPNSTGSKLVSFFHYINGSWRPDTSIAATKTYSDNENITIQPFVNECKSNEVCHLCAWVSRQLSPFNTAITSYIEGQQVLPLPV